LTPDWHTPDHPPLRPTAPWIMEEMILEQRLLGDESKALPGAAELAALISAAVRDGGDISVAGCGTSEHAAHAIAALIRTSAPAARVVARQALDAAEAPGHPALAIGISHDGGTRATQLALEAAGDAATAAITARLDSAVAGAAGTVVVTPRLDRSWCHTLAYTSAIIAGAVAAGLPSTDIAAAAAILSDDGLFRDARAAGRTLLPASRIVTAGMGIDLIAARELALKIEEGARVPATAHHLETLLHGHLAACDASTTHLVVFASDPAGGDRRDHRAAIAIQAAATIDIPVTVVLPSASELEVPTGVSALRIELAPRAPLLGTLLGEALALQALTLGAIDVAGWNPDLIRRESAPYRAAATLGDASDW
jgi:fructoselysine-6-P-deglycase FrlB-like protein